MKPNLTSVEVKPKIINDRNARSPKKTSSPIKQSKASPVKPNLATIEAKHLNQNMNNSNDQPVIPYDLESDMSPSEIVKLRKRGKKASIDSLKRIVSPEKSNKKSPARRSPRKAPVKQSKPTVKGKTSFVCSLGLGWVEAQFKFGNITLQSSFCVKLDFLSVIIQHLNWKK